MRGKNICNIISHVITFRPGPWRRGIPNLGPDRRTRTQTADQPQTEQTSLILKKWFIHIFFLFLKSYFYVFF